MLENLLLVEEYQIIPQNVLFKLEKILKENSEQYLTTKALFETFKRDQENQLTAIEETLRQETLKNENLSVQFNLKCTEIDELEKKLKSLDRQNLQIKSDIIRLESEARNFRQQRDDAVDEKSSLQAMLNRRTSELEQLKADYDLINEKFSVAISAKHKALASLDEIQSRKMELDSKEKTLDKERELLMERINLLTNEVTKYSQDLILSNREHTTRLMDFQTQIQRKDEEIRVLLENEVKFKTQLDKQSEKINELNARLSGRSEIESQLQNKYLLEIESRTKLADMYKTMSEESNAKVEELANTTKELQKLLNDASLQYEELERRFAVNEATYEEHLRQKNETIAALKKELIDANSLIDTLKEGRLADTLENLSPHAAAAYNMMKKGLTLTQIYSEYASVSEQLMIKTHDNEQLHSTFKSFVEELEGKAHIIQKRNEDYAEAMETIHRISQEFEQLEIDYNITKEKHAEAERHICRLTREKEKMQKTVSDLSRQICFLLKEVEEARGGEILMQTVNDDANTSGITNSSDIISKKLVTFRDIEELQDTNNKLLNIIRDLSEDFEKAEAKLKECDNEAMKEKMGKLENSLEERIEAAARQDKIIQMLKNQLKMYQLTSPGSKHNSLSTLNDDMNISLSSRDMRPMSIQTDSREIESMVCAELRKELDSAQQQLIELKADFQTSTQEHAKNERMMEETLTKCERKYQQLSQDHIAAVSRAESLDEKCKSMAMNIESLKTEISALDSRCKLYTQTIASHEQSIHVLREEAMNATKALSKAEIMMENLKRECTLLRSSEASIRAERDMLKQYKQSHAHLLSNVESIKASIDRSESEWKVKMDEKLDSLLKECSALRRRLQDEQDQHNERLNFLNQTTESLKNRLEDEKKSNYDLVEVTNSLKLDIEEKNKTIEELKSKIKCASSKSVMELELSMKGLQNKYDIALRDVENQKELLQTAKKDAEDFKNLSENMETQLVSERENHEKYRKDMEAKISEMAGELAGMRNRNDCLQKRVNELAGINESSMVSLSDELQQERQKYAETNEKVAKLEQKLLNAENELKLTTETLGITKEKYHEEMKQHTSNIKALQSKGDAILDLEHKISCLIVERDEALRKAESVNINWREEETRMMGEIEAQQEKMKTVVQLNELLLNQIEELSSKIACAQRQDHVNFDTSSSSDQSDRASDNMMQLINYLRREKNLANSTIEVLRFENTRLKSEVDLIKRQLEEAHQQLQAEQEKSDVSSTTAAKHAELVNKVQTLNALVDSNRVLREERDHCVGELSELKHKLNEIETNTIVPLRDENKRLQLQVESLQTEITGLSKECSMWRNRVTEMTEKINKTNSEELKDLKKTLNKEREEYNKTLETLRNLKQEKSKLEEQVKKLQLTTNKVSQLEKEKSELQKELISEKSKLEKVGIEFEEYRKTQEKEIERHKQMAGQLKSVARRYKATTQELTDQNKQLGEEVKQLQTQVNQAGPPVAENGASGGEISVDEQNRLKQEGRQELESELSDQMKQLNDEITANQSKIAELEANNKNLKDTVAEKDLRNTNILKKAKTTIQSLNKVIEKTKSEQDGIQKQLDEYIARESVMKSRISMLEKEKNDTLAERDRLSREVDLLTQRSNTLQRHLHSQQGVKSNANSSQEKSLSETPTANIKPMAGPSSSVTKSQQNQQSVAVTPWRSASETPLASIRPMSMPQRTAAVLPTSQTSCSSSQSTVVVPPQQQLVDTSSNAPSIVEAFSSSPSSSSHSDYNMPSTSSSVSHPTLRQVVVTPTQQSSHSAESTQDVEAECINQEIASQTSHTGQQSSQVSQNQPAPLSTLTQIMATPTVSQSQMPTVALVLPRIDLQNISTASASQTSNSSDLSVVASSQNNIMPIVSASNQTDSSSNAAKRTETCYQQDNEDSNLGQVSASNQLGQQQAVVASSIETAPEQSVVIASSQQSYEKTMVESSVASSNAGSSNTVTTTQAGLKRARETDGENSKSGSNTETTSVLPQIKRSRRMEPVHEDMFRGDIDETNNSEVLLKYRGFDVEYQVPTSSQRDQEFDNLGIDSEAEDEPEEDEQTMPDDGIIDENDDGQEYVEDEEEVENEEVYEGEEYDREEQDTTMTSYNIIEGPDIDEETVQVQDQDNEVEIIDEESNEVPNQSTRSDSSSLAARRNIEQSSEATSSGNNMRPQSANITSNQPTINLQFGRRPSAISPLNRQQNQQLLLSQGFEENVGDDSIVPSTPTLCVPRRTDGFGEAVSSPQVPSAARFTFSDGSSTGARAGVAQMISEGIDDTRMDLSQLEEHSGTGRSVPSTPIQSSPQDIEQIEIGQSGEDIQRMNEESSINSNQPQQQAENGDGDCFQNDSTNNGGIEISIEPNNLGNEISEVGRDINSDVTSDSGTSEQAILGTSQSSRSDIEEGREAEALMKMNEVRTSPHQPILTTNQTARRGVPGRPIRSRGVRSPAWVSNIPRNRGPNDMSQDGEADNMMHNRRGNFRGRKINKWYPYGKRF